jgi:hypothetical protein
MSLPTYPEDSVLKRHFDANVEMKRQMWLQSPPTDSILYRHATSLGNNPVTRSAGAPRRAAPSAAAASASVRTAPPVKSESKGFFAWLSGLLFGRA